MLGNNQNAQHASSSQTSMRGSSIEAGNDVRLLLHFLMMLQFHLTNQSSKIYVCGSYH